MLIGLLILAGVLFSQLRGPKVALSLSAIEEAGTLVVVTRNSPTTYYEGRDGPAGFEVDLVQNFAASLGVDVVFRVEEEVSDLLDAVRSGEAHFAAAGLTVTPERQEEFRFAPPYSQVAQQVVCRQGRGGPNSVEDLVGKTIVVTAESSHAEALRRASETVPDLEWSESAYGPETLMEQVWEEDFDCTVADQPVFRVTRRHLPELVAAFSLTEEEPLAWMLSPRAEELGDRLDRWFARDGVVRDIDRLSAAHFGFFPSFDFVNMARFRADIDDVLPAYERDLRRAGQRTGLPWKLLAAIGYQESKWNPDAVSATGVQGFMMLTRTTAARVGVEDRENPRQSIRGGAEYYEELLERVPDGVTGDDRYWFALAAYNMGMGHVYDARVLAERRGLNKNIWVDVKQVLPLLSQRAEYSTLRHGYARGYEAKRYVEHVRTYWHVLNELR